MADEVVAPAPVKPGWKTTEFWLNLAAMLVGVGLTIGGMLNLGPNSKIMMILGVASTLLGATGHTVSRTIVKASMVLVCCLALSGCASINKEALKAATDSEVELMSELSAYVDSDTKKTDDLKAAEKAKIKAHLDLINALRK